MEQTTHPAWSAQQNRELLVQRWRGTELAKFQVPTKSPAACKKQWQRFHAKVLDATMASLPEHASSDFVAELSELMSD